MEGKSFRLRTSCEVYNEIVESWILTGLLVQGILSEATLPQTSRAVTNLSQSGW